MGTISLSAKERRRLALFSQVASGDRSLKNAAETLGLSYRQAKRSFSRWRAEGDAGLAHRSRGRSPARGDDPTADPSVSHASSDDRGSPPSSPRQARAELRRNALAAFVERYADVSVALAVESLAEEGLVVARETLRRWLAAEGLRTSKRRVRPHRLRRARRPRFGELVQMDGSHHDWFEGRRAWAVLMVAVDDATGRVFARFFEQETFEAACETFQLYAEHHGLPQALYVDRAGIYRSDREPTIEEIAAGIEPVTQFGRAMQDLEVELIKARSPQAKGRVERMNGTLQQRLPFALRRAKINDLASANQFLDETFLARFNARFARPAASSEDAHRPLADRDLPRILSEQEERVVRNDWTVIWRTRVLQIPRSESPRVQPGDRVCVCAQRDGRRRVFLKSGVELTWSDVRETRPPAARKPAAQEAATTSATRAGRTSEIVSSPTHKPKATHPWRGRPRAAV